MEIEYKELKNAKISDVIKALEELKSKYGDLDVFGLNEDVCYNDELNITINEINESTAVKVVSIF